MPKRNAVGEVHHLINEERRKRGLPHVYRSKEMYRLAKDQANYCAKVGRLVHSDRFAFRGGENLCGGKGNFSPKTIVKTWMRSKAGHREYLLSPRVRKAAVAISTSKRGTYAAWAFSDQPPDSHDCPYYKTPHLKFKTPFRLKVKGGGGMLRLPVNLLLKCISVLGIILGAHGFYVYLHRIDFPTVGAEKLFLVLSVPLRLQGLVSWMTAEGIHGWFIPIVFVVAGMVLWSYSNRIGGQFTLLRKLHLW